MLDQCFFLHFIVAFIIHKLEIWANKWTDLASIFWTRVFFSFYFLLTKRNFRKKNVDENFFEKQRHLCWVCEMRLFPSQNDEQPCDGKMLVQLLVRATTINIEDQATAPTYFVCTLRIFKRNFVFRFYIKKLKNNFKIISLRN